VRRIEEAAEQDWHAAAFLLERRYRERWAREVPPKPPEDPKKLTTREYIEKVMTEWLPRLELQLAEEDEAERKAIEARALRAKTAADDGGQW
jgi:hypothetical protein